MASTVDSNNNISTLTREALQLQSQHLFHRIGPKHPDRYYKNKVLDCVLNIEMAFSPLVTEVKTCVQYTFCLPHGQNGST